MKIRERKWNWWAYFWRVLHRQSLRGIAQWDRKVVRFIVHELGCTRGQTLLDLGCGSGEHTRMLAQKGVKCTGVEIAQSLVRHARTQARRARVQVDYRCVDMRRITYDEQFDFCILISGTFGFFSDRQNQSLVRRIERALKPGGKLLLDIRNARVPRKGGRSWMKIHKGYLLMVNSYDAEHKRECGDCVFFDASGNVNVLTRALRRAGNRLYILPEMKVMLRTAGLEYMSAYCGFQLPAKTCRRSYKHNIVIIAQKTT
jgi:2-polyprenyl-3-methyl-5-hydroxy-6-metoxy-1,4-benzoquinol methylase